jgi:uncharacterized protein (TIGR00369 family)
VTRPLPDLAAALAAAAASVEHPGPLIPEGALGPDFPAARRADVELVLSLPFQRLMGFELVRITRDGAESRLRLDARHATPAGTVHGGVLYGLLDPAAYLALLPHLPEGANASTHDIFVSVMRPAPIGADLRFHARVIRSGRRVAFLDAEARLGDTVYAAARITKTVFGA